MYINVVVFLQENDDVEGYAADYISLLLLHFHKKDVRGTVRRASLKDAIWLGPLVGTLLCLMYINVVENDDAVYKKMMTLNDDVDLRTHEFDSAGRLFPPNMLVTAVSASCTSTSSFLLFPPNMLVAPVPAFFDENR